MGSTIHICGTSSINTPSTNTKTSTPAINRPKNSILQGSMIHTLVKLMEVVVVQTSLIRAVA